MTTSRLQTISVRAGIASDEAHGAVVPPLHLSTNFTFHRLGERRPYDYTRSGNPTRALLEQALADLEGGHGAVVTASGMAAVTLALQLAGVGETVVVPHDCYGGTMRLFRSYQAQGRLSPVVLDFQHPEALARLRTAKPSLVWLETPSNPLLAITDLVAVSAAAHEVGALVVVDNTFLSPWLQSPLALGADVVVHSTTKYLNGHGDVVGGVVVSKTAALHEQVAFWGNCLGLTGAPFDAFLTLRGLRTLSARWRVHQENAVAVVDVLTRHPAVARVFYPGLPSHPGHALAKRQQRGFGAMVSLELKGGLEAARRFTDAVRVFCLAESLGGVESLVAHPATMTHASMPPGDRAVAGIGDGLLRLSVGLEAEGDLVADLQRGLDAARSLEAPAFRPPPVEAPAPRVSG
ncbi:MAG: cystathionine gamma-synthase [Myxococcaceae bacterium]|jgi:cystathionine gamma-synthase|nr:cystathionine gamma-synthase [Myxococcaceae bacterium]